MSAATAVSHTALATLAFFGKTANYLTVWEKAKSKLPFASWEVVTPEKAAEYLKNNFDNRKLRTSTVSFYATAIKNNQWYLSHQPIAFDTDGVLIDGQHRLAAVIMAGVPVIFLIVRNTPKETKQICDQNLKRGGDDVLRWAGEQYSGAAPSLICRRAMLGLKWDYKISNPDLVLFSQQYHKNIQFAMNCFKRSGNRDVAIKAVVARAHYNGADESMLEEFASIRFNGQKSEDSPAKGPITAVLRLRDFVMSHTVRSAGSIIGVYEKCEQSLNLFLDGNDMGPKQRLTGVNVETFPLPWDDVAKDKVEEEEREKARQRQERLVQEMDDAPAAILTVPAAEKRGRGRPKKRSA